MTTQISPLPVPPTVSDPASFDVRADAFVLALPLFKTEANQLATEVNEAAQAIIGTYATSTSSILTGTGSKSLTLSQTNKTFWVGQLIVIYRTSSPTVTYMYGQITAFNAGTGAMTVNISSAFSTVTATDWTIAASAPILAPVIVGSVIGLQTNFGIF